MACPTCDHTMHKVGTAAEVAHLYWCPRCGTIRETWPDTTVVDEAPALVPRVGNLLDWAPPELREKLWTLGITEACRLPAARRASAPQEQQ